MRTLLGFGVIVPSRVSPIGILPEILERARNDISANGGEMLFVYLPAYARYRVLVGEGVPGRREVLSAVHDLGIPLLDLDLVFRSTGDPEALWAHPRGHLNPDGYAVMASAIQAALADVSSP